MKDNTLLEFVWTDAFGCARSKTKVFAGGIPAVEKLSPWWFDGSSTGQSKGTDSDVFLKPRRVYNDPFRKGQKMVLCDVYDDIECTKPNFSNKRAEFALLAEKHKEKECWTGIEQEYVIMDRMTNIPACWKSPDEPGAGPQGPYYCGVGGAKSFRRDIVDEHLIKCLEAGVTIYGVNSEVMPSQWEFQIGTGEPLRMSDDLVMARYLLERVTEGKDVYINWHPKPYADWNGSGAHTNFSTKAMREEGGFEAIKAAMVNMAETHKTDVLNYGEDNHLRLTGVHETSSLKEFSWNSNDRSMSVKLAAGVEKLGKGYFEDRRPASNMNPYLVFTTLYKTLFRD